MTNIMCNNCYLKMIRNLTRIHIYLRRFIFEFIEPIKVVNLNHEYYKKYHYIIATKIDERNYINYITDMIRKDNILAFQYIINELNMNKNCNQLLKKQRYTYKKKNYHCLYDYLLFLSKFHESNNCKNLLLTL